MSYFYLHLYKFQSAKFTLIKKSHLLFHQKENIHQQQSIIHKTKITKSILPLLAKTIFIKLNKITLYANFNKRKREYIVIPIIPIGAYFYIQNKTTLLITLLAKKIQYGKFLQSHKYKQRIKQYTTLLTQKNNY